MWYRVAKKEIEHSLNAQAGLLIIVVFTATLPLPIFWLDGGANIFTSGNADLRGFFGLLPLFLMVFVPALAMRSWAEERSSGAYELLVSYPLRPRDLVLGKFLGNYALCVVCLLGTLTAPLLVSWLGRLDSGPVIGGYLAALLLAAACLALSMFLGSLTQNQLTAFLISFVVLAALMFVQIPFVNFHARFTNIARGLLDTRDLIYYAAVTGLFLFLNVQRVQWGRG